MTGLIGAVAHAKWPLIEYYYCNIPWILGIPFFVVTVSGESPLGSAVKLTTLGSLTAFLFARQHSLFSIWITLTKCQICLFQQRGKLILLPELPAELFTAKFSGVPNRMPILQVCIATLVHLIPCLDRSETNKLPDSINTILQWTEGIGTRWVLFKINGIVPGIWFSPEGQNN